MSRVYFFIKNSKITEATKLNEIPRIADKRIDRIGFLLTNSAILKNFLFFILFISFLI